MSSLDELEAAVVACDRAGLGRAITLVESQREDHQALAQELLRRLLGRTGGALRVGITGVPGVGKSTFIEALGTWLTERGHRVAVLAVDPTSRISRGSILGDKTRMQRLANDPAAFIRPSPSGGSLGGVARKTRETILLCEAAGFDVVLVETVGVGQSETTVADMVDCFLLLLLPGGGDELQGIKRGIMELADVVAITKADGANADRALAAQRDFAAALRYLPSPSQHWRPAVVAISALEGRGIPELWQLVRDHREVQLSTGELESRRKTQRVHWFWAMLEEGLIDHLRHTPAIASRLPTLEAKVAAGELTPTAAAREVLASFGAA